MDLRLWLSVSERNTVVSIEHKLRLASSTGMLLQEQVAQMMVGNGVPEGWEEAMREQEQENEDVDADTGIDVESEDELPGEKISEPRSEHSDEDGDESTTSDSDM